MLTVVQAFDRAPMAEIETDAAAATEGRRPPLILFPESAYAAGENYFPEGMAPKRYYQPVPRGLEIKIAEALMRRKK